MPAACAVRSCRNNRINVKELGLDVMFHEFPKQETIRNAWKEFCGRGENWQPTKNALMCSVHFNPHDYQMHNAPLVKSTSLRKLNPTAVPSVIKLPEDGKQVQNNPNEIWEEQRRIELYGACVSDTSSSIDNHYVELDEIDSCKNHCAMCKSKDADIEKLEQQVKILTQKLEDPKKLQDANLVLKQILDTSIQETKVLKKQNTSLAEESKKLKLGSVHPTEIVPKMKKMLESTLT